MKIDKLYIMQFDVNETTFEGSLLRNDGCKFKVDESSSYNVRDRYCNTDYTAKLDGGWPSYDYIMLGNSSTSIYNRDELIKKNFTADKKINASNLKDSSFYRTPKLALPQTKMQLLKEKYNIKVIRDKSKADYIITSYSYIENAFLYNWQSIHKAKDVKDIYLDRIKNYLSSTTLHNIIEFLDHVIAQDGYIKIHLDWPYSFKTQSKTSFKSLDDLDAFKYATIKDYNVINFMLNNANNIIFDKDMLDFCNEDSITLTNEDCMSISKMIKSSDEVTIALALEMMANCNIQKSYDKIALIFAFYYDIIRYATNWNTVNVKSLRKKMKDVPKVDTRNLYVNAFNNLVKHLHLNNYLTKFAVGAITNKICNTSLQHCGLTDKDSVFDLNVKNLKIKNQYIESENNNLPF